MMDFRAPILVTNAASAPAPEPKDAHYAPELEKAAPGKGLATALDGGPRQ